MGRPKKHNLSEDEQFYIKNLLLTEEIKSCADLTSKFNKHFGKNFTQMQFTILCGTYNIDLSVLKKSKYNFLLFK